MRNLLSGALGAVMLGTSLLAPRVAVAQGTSFDFSIPNIMRGPELYGRPPGGVRWSADGRWIYFNWNVPGSPWHATREHFRVRAVPGAKPEKLTPAQFDSIAPLLAIDSVGGTAVPQNRLSQGRYLAVEHDGDLYVTDLERGTSRRLTQTLAQERSPQFSQDGSRVYFVRENNVFSIALDGGLVRQHTDLRAGPAPADTTRGGTGQRGRLEQQQLDLFEAIRDRVRLDSIQRAERRAAAERRLRTHYTMRGEELASVTPSPGGNALLLTTRFPAQGTRGVDVPRFVTETGYTEQIRGRTLVGDVQDRGRVALLNVATGALTWLTPFGADTAAMAFVRPLGWSPDGRYGAFMAHARDNKTRVLQVVDASGRVTTLDTLRDSAWVGGPCSFGCTGWYDGGRRFFYVSEASGFAHLYTVAADGSDKRQLTSGRWEVLDVDLSRDGRTFYLHTNEPSPFEEQLYRMPVTGGARERITTKSGRHVAVVSPDGQWLANVYSYVNRPPELFLMRNRPGAEMSQLTVSPSAEWLSFPWIEPEIVMIPASDGAQVAAHIYRPADMKAQPNGAGVIFVHGAGYLHNVGNFWSEYPREYMFNQYLASKGYVVLDLDYRASAGYGRDWRTAIYRHMGGRDLQDHVDASRYLNREFGIDPERVGIYGGSYGGFITLFALFTEAEHFGAGAALRSVTDWAHYNQGYTSNILNLPQTDTLAFRRSSPIYFAEGLKDPLVILHGMVDTNVLFADVVRLTQRLIELGKTGWELAVYPVEDHAFLRPSSWADEYRRIFEIFEENLPSRVPIKPDAP